MQEIANYHGSPFDAIRQVDGQGNEYWSARDLQELLGYAKWERFEDTILRAMTACQNSGHNPEDHFPDAGKLLNRGSRGGTQEVKDYHLTRYACYLVAMNGDSRKEEIAAAQTYFAVKTREAEIIQLQDYPYVNADFVRRLELNEKLIPYNYWTVLEELDKESIRTGLRFDKLVDNARPDISIGKMWKKHLEENGYDMSQIKKVENIVNPRTTTARYVNAFSVNLLGAWRIWLHEQYKEHFEKNYLPSRIEEKQERIEGQMNAAPKQINETSSNTREEEDIQAYLRRISKEICILLRSRDKNTFKIGELLISVKGNLPYKAFTPWIEEELPISRNMARRYMKVFKKFGDKASQLGHIPFGALYELTLPSISQDLIDSVLSGEYIPTEQELRVLNSSQPQEKELPVVIRNEQPASQVSIQDLVTQLQQKINAFTPEIQVKEVVKYVTPPEVLEENAKLRQETNKYYESWEKCIGDIKAATEEIAQLRQESNMIMKDRNNFVERYESLLQEHASLQQEYASLQKDREKLHGLMKRFTDVYAQICTDKKTAEQAS